VRRVITVDDDEREAQYGCCTFQTRCAGKNQAPVELAPTYKNKWANRWTSYWFYAPIAVIGQNSKHEEVTSYDLASRMIHLEVELSLELTKTRCRVYSPGTHARKEEDRLLLEFPCNPTRTRTV
jgi:hypothetical protein